jgi:hypothetical protein
VLRRSFFSHITRAKNVKHLQAVAEIPFRSSKPFLINLGLAPGDLKTRPSGFKQLKSLIFRFAKIYYKNVLMTTQRDSLWATARLLLNRSFARPDNSVQTEPNEVKTFNELSI